MRVLLHHDRFVAVFAERNPVDREGTTVANRLITPFTSFKEQAHAMPTKFGIALGAREEFIIVIVVIFGVVNQGVEASRALRNKVATWRLNDWLEHVTVDLPAIQSM